MNVVKLDHISSQYRWSTNLIRVGSSDSGRDDSHNCVGLHLQRGQSTYDGIDAASSDWPVPGAVS